MRLRFPALAPPTFNVLCLGERGTGKTVFLIGSYAEFQRAIASLRKKKKSKNKNSTSQLYFECQGMGETILLNNILQYVFSQGCYPPPTLAITDFNFAITERKSDRHDLVGFVRWWDMPGEYCHFGNSYYQKMAINSHAICLFINANRLVEDESYQGNFTYIQSQLMILVGLVKKFDLKYPFAIIFTQCDLLSSELSPEEQILPKAQPLLNSLEEASINYQCFYSAITIENRSDSFELRSNQVSTALSWIVTNLSQAYQEGRITNLRVLSVLHCLHCGSDRFRSSRNIPLAEKLQLLTQLRWQYHCKQCGKLKVEFLPFVVWHFIRNFLKKT